MMRRRKFLDLDEMIDRATQARRRRDKVHLVVAPASSSPPPRPRAESTYPKVVLQALRESGPSTVPDLVVVPVWSAPAPLSTDMVGRGIAHLLRAGLVRRTDEVVATGGAIWIRYGAVAVVRHRSRRLA